MGTGKGPYALEHAGPLATAPCGVNHRQIEMAIADLSDMPIILVKIGDLRGLV